MTSGRRFESLSTAEVAEACGVTTQAVDAWRGAIPESDGVWKSVTAEGRGKNASRAMYRWDLPRLIEWRLARALGHARESAKDRPLSAVEHEQHRKLKLANDAAAGLLVDRLMLERQWAKVGADLRQRLETIGRKHGPVVANDIARTMEELNRQVHGVMGGKPDHG